MIRARGLFLADGSSDEPLGQHVASLARAHGVALDVVTPEFDRMAAPPGRAVGARLDQILRIDPDFDVLLVHRDAEGQAPSLRVSEITAALESASVDWPVVPVIPIRMTEAWLLLDERAIRVVAGRPSRMVDLDLPSAGQVEAVPDPKSLLREALAVASGLSGRRLRKFKRDFPAHRRQLLERLDRAGPVQGLSAWASLELSTAEAMASVLTATQ